MDDDVHLDFGIPFEWNIDGASKRIALWLTDDSQSPAFSIVGLLSSARFHEMLGQAVELHLSGQFRVLIHLALPATCYWDGGGISKLQRGRDSFRARLC